MLTLLGVFVFVIVATAGITLWRAARNEARAEAQWPPEGEILVVDGHRVHAVVMGNGPDLVLIHGSGGNARDLTLSLAPRLARQYRVIVFDRPGLGYTDRFGDGSLRAQAELLQKAAAQLGARQPVVMGHSYGGSVALAWAVHLPDSLSALVPVATPSHPWPPGLARIYAITSPPLGQALVVPIMTAFVGPDYVSRTLTGIFEPQSVPDRYASHVGPGLTLRRVSLRATAVQRARLRDDIIALAPEYEAIQVPVEIVHGTADTTVSPLIHSEKLAADVADSRYTPLPGIGHMPHHGNEDAVVAAIDRAAVRAGLR